MLELHIRNSVQAENGGVCQVSGAYKHPSRQIGTYELIFVRKGQLVMVEDDQVFALDEGEYLILQPHRQHRGKHSSSDALVFYWIHFDIIADAASKALAKSPGFRLKQRGHVARPDHLTVTFRRFLDDQETGWLTQNTANTLLELMLLEAGAAETGGKQKERSPEAVTNEAIAYIRSNLSERLTTAHIARAQKLNPDYLGRVFKQSTGQTVTETIHQYRVGMAQSLLIDSNYKIDEISRMCGFAEPNFFRRIFKRKTGVAPRTFRRLYDKRHVTKEVRISPARPEESLA